ncbi:uncharacterized protein [Coffea arabica]|uniref:Myeloid leukemia factor 1-like n=1 Tax=Coffea arabica TaxID=13443 RepID=A0A6P6WCR2_COFAR
MSGIFGGRDPFDDPFFTRPFGGLFGSKMSFSAASPGDPVHSNRLKAPIIEELDIEDDNISGGGEDPETASANQNPFVEHPEDQIDDHHKSKTKSKSKELVYRSDHNKVGGERPQKGSVSFQKVTYGGINGAYYTASATRRTGNDGVVLEDRKEADSTTGQATHRISKGIIDKGHSVTRQLNADGKVDTMQTLHNLDEDELAGFDQSWRGSADMHLPGWDMPLDFHSKPGIGGSRLTSWSGWGQPTWQQLGRDASLRPGAQNDSARGRPKKTVTIPIE